MPATRTLRQSDDLLWKALADPSRRAILDLLRKRPMTTTEIGEHFAMSRFGVMKHLRVLAGAELVIVRPEGRERFQYLNPVPIQRICERWLRPFSAASAQALLRLKDLAEKEPS